MFQSLTKTRIFFMSQVRNNPYQVLGLSKSAGDLQIKKTYLKLAKKYHPDLNPNYSEKFKQINEAYNKIKDPTKRREFISEDFQQTQQSQYHHTNPFRQQDPFRYSNRQHYYNNYNFSDQYERQRYRYYQKMYQSTRKPFQNSSYGDDPFQMNFKERQQYRRQMYMQGYSISSWFSTFLYMSVIMSTVFIIGSMFYLMYSTSKMASQRQHVTYQYIQPRRRSRHGEYDQ